MNEKKKSKVCIVSISLGTGGAERSTAMLSKMLSGKGFDVHMVILTNTIDYDYEGSLFNLGLFKEKDDSTIGRVRRFLKFRSYLKKHQFDYIIDNRTRQFEKVERFYLNYLYRGNTIIYVVRSFKLDAYFPKDGSIAAKMIRKSHAVVGVSKAIATTINTKYGSEKAIHIYNPIEADTVVPKVSNGNYILFLGRLVENVKNFTLLLEGYKNSVLPSKGIMLKIYGDGADKGFIERKISEENLENFVSVHPFQAEISEVLSKAKFLALTSYYEGFPRVLIEALSHGVPVVSVNCESGPNEIIQHEQNGLLVENHNPKALTGAFNRMIEDEALYLSMKEHAFESIAHLSMNEIAQQWEQVLTT